MLNHSPQAFPSKFGYNPIQTGLIFPRFSHVFPGLPHGLPRLALPFATFATFVGRVFQEALSTVRVTSLKAHSARDHQKAGHRAWVILRWVYDGFMDVNGWFWLIWWYHDVWWYLSFWYIVGMMVLTVFSFIMISELVTSWKRVSNPRGGP